MSRRIYELSREVIEFQRATRPLLGMLAALEAGFSKYVTSEELQRYLRDVADHATTVVERVDDFQKLLTSILTVNATLVTQAQNEEMKNLTEASYAQNEEIKRVSAWAAILFAPTLIGTVYGMNFDHMPELHWAGRLPAGTPELMLHHLSRALHDVQTAELAVAAKGPSNCSRVVRRPAMPAETLPPSAQA